MPLCCPLSLAPMAELSHRALRELIHGFLTQIPSAGPGSGLLTHAKVSYFTEMISAAGLLSGGPFEKWYLDNGPCPQQLVYQLMGADAGQLVQAAALLDREDCLGIDINMGCSAPAITRTGAGVRWMKDADKAARLIEALRKVTKKQLSAKIRLGFFKLGAGGAVSGAESGVMGECDDIAEFLVKFCRALEEAGLDAITLHPRLATEKFKRKARWEYVDILRKELRIPVAGNGDIDNIDDLACKAGEGPVMSGRLLVRQPWAFAAVLGNSKQQVNIEETGLCFLELLAKYQPPEFHLSRARRFFKYYCGNVQWAEYLRNRINREESLGGIERVWKAYFTAPVPS